MQSRIFTTRSEEETIALGREIAPGLAPGAVLLIGGLGAGKTTLAKGIVEGLKAATANEVSSPTFTLIHQYGNGTPVYHVDLYRLDDVREVQRLGLEELFDSGSVVLLEWAERFPALLPRARTEIRLLAMPDETREISIDTMSEDRT